MRTATILFLITLLFLNRLFAQENINKMPSVEKVIATIKGEDEIHTYAKQIGTFMQLKQMLYYGDIFGPKKYQTQHELSLTKNYNNAIEQLGKEYYAKTNDKSNKLSMLCSDYQFDKNLTQEIVSHLFPAPLQEQYSKWHTVNMNRLNTYKAQENNQQLQTGYLERSKYNKRKGWAITSLGVFLMICSFVINMLLNRNQFNNTNEYGVVEFPSYISMVIHNIKFLLSRLLLSAGLIIFVIGAYYLS